MFQRLLITIFSLFAFVLPLAFASASASSSVQYLAPSSNVSPNQTVSFYVATSGFTNPIFNLSDSFPNSTIAGGNINSTGNFSWAPSPSDMGSHNITVSISDGLGDISSVTQQINVGTAPTMNIGSVNPGNVVTNGTPITFSVSTSGFNSPTFALSDQFTGGLNTPSTVKNTNIDSNGNFSWTPAASDIGMHNITVNVADFSGHSTSASIALTVNPSITMVIQTSMQSSTVNPGQNVSFNAYVNGINYPTFSVKDDFSGTTVTAGDLNSSGSFLWIPTQSDIGTHNLTITATDGMGHVSTAVKSITVQNVSIAIQGLTPGPYVVVGSAISFNTPVSGFTTPSFDISDSFPGSSILGGMINGAGFFNWTPVAYDVGTHNLTITALDNTGHTASINLQIGVYATPQAASIAQNANAQNGNTQSALTGASNPGISTSTPFAFSSYLYQGQTSSDVAQLQFILAKLGFFNATPSGYYGPATKTAVQKFQAAHGLSQLGVVGPATRLALNNLQNIPSNVAAAAVPTPTPTVNTYKFSTYLTVGSSGGAVSELQKRLTTEGVYSGPINGKFGPLTQSAVKAFQAKYGLSRLGVVGPATRAELNK